MTHPKCMADIYRRLKSLGFESRFVRTVLLPDWWEDDAAAVPYNRALIETTISRHLGISPSLLRDPKAELVLPAMPPVRLKSATRDSSVARIRPSIQIALHVADLICRATPELPPFAAPKTAQEVRSDLLTRSVPVTLQSLVEWCWAHGISVAHLSRLPEAPGYRKFDGIVAFVGQRPCILLAEKNDSPPMLAFHLAHELGHLLLGHVAPGSELLADDNLERIVTDDVEDAADAFASEILTGHATVEMNAVYGLTGDRLAQRARDVGRRLMIDPGVFTLMYGRSADRWPAATLALKKMGLHSGAKRTLHHELSSRLDLNLLTEADRSFLEALTSPADMPQPADGVAP